MSLKKREKILLALGVGILLSGFFMTQGDNAAPIQTGMSSLVGSHAEESALLAKHLLPTQTLSVKDPFYAYAPQAHTQNIELSQQTTPTLRLEGIFLDTQGYAAVINGTVVRLGEWVADAIVVKSIQGNRVILSHDEQEIVLDF